MGRVRGSAGNMTGCKVYDKNVLRAKAFEVSNPNTAAQQTQRDFFKEVAATVATVSEEELRSLFGIIPKAMSRRNALSKQVAAAYSVDATGKHVDFSKLQAIGNGQKVTTPFLIIEEGVFEAIPHTLSMFGANAKLTTNIILVQFVTAEEKIYITNTTATIQDIIDDDIATWLNEYVKGDGFAYLTCDSKGDDVSDRNFGSFIIKTRAEKKGRGNTPEPATVDIQASGYSAWDTFTIDLSGTSAAGGTPTSLVNDGNVVAGSFSEAGEDVFTGSFTQAVDPSAATTLLVTMPDTTQITMNVNFVD